MENSRDEVNEMRHHASSASMAPLWGDGGQTETAFSSKGLRPHCSAINVPLHQSVDFKSVLRRTVRQVSNLSIVAEVIHRVQQGVAETKNGP
jgi:hypothetical protein